MNVIRLFQLLKAPNTDARNEELAEFVPKLIELAKLEPLSQEAEQLWQRLQGKTGTQTIYLDEIPAANELARIDMLAFPLNVPSNVRYANVSIRPWPPNATPVATPLTKGQIALVKELLRVGTFDWRNVCSLDEAAELAGRGLISSQQDLCSFSSEAIKHHSRPEKKSYTAVIMLSGSRVKFHTLEKHQLFTVNDTLYSKCAPETAICTATRRSVHFNSDDLVQPVSVT